jgi:ribulose-phosphate 3-epimerase
MSPLQVQEDLGILCQAFDAVHVDVMDGHFCKSIHLSPAFVAAIRPVCTVPIDVHLMVTEPSDYIGMLAECGADSVTIHVEVISRDAHRLIGEMRMLGLRVGVGLCPATPLSAITELLPLVDMVTVLGVDPGYVGQPLVPGTVSKIERLAALRNDMAAGFLIQVDGGVRSETLELLSSAGAEGFVLGMAALFGRGATLRSACASVLRDFRERLPVMVARQ